MQLHRRARRLGSTLLRFRLCGSSATLGRTVRSPDTNSRRDEHFLPVCRFTLDPLRVGEIALRELVTVPSTVDAPADIFGLGSGQSRGRRKRRSRHDPVCRQWRAHLRSRPRARPHQHRVWSRLKAGQGCLSRSKHRPRLKSRVKSQGKSCRIGKMAEK
jgi:hypothetical protein